MFRFDDPGLGSYAFHLRGKHVRVTNLILGGILLSSLLVVACGDDDDDNTTGTATRPASTATTGGQTTTPTSGQTTTTPTTGGGEEVTVDLEEVEASGVSGEATLSEDTAGAVTVAISLDDAAFVGEANIHAGTCDDFEEVAEYTVGAIAAGELEEDVDVSMDDLDASDYVIVITDAAGGDPVACGAI